MPNLESSWAMSEQREPEFLVLL